MSKDTATLNEVAIKSRELQTAKIELRLEADAWVERKSAEFEAELERAVLAALEDDHSVSNVARAYTTNPESTPNRNAIYNIIAKHKDQPVMMGDYPFEWVVRKVRTQAGTKKVYDVHVELSDFGPQDVSGEFTWRYDPITHELDEQLGVEDPYPVNIKYYKQVLDRWLMSNPYPGGE